MAIFFTECTFLCVYFGTNKKEKYILISNLFLLLGDTATFRCNAVYDSDLRLKIKWLKDRELIDFETEPRFVQSSDQSLTITKTTELDSGTYTCLAESELDKAEASATLIVQDVPNPPGLRWVSTPLRNELICPKIWGLKVWTI